MFKRILAAASAVLLGAGIAVVGISPANADQPEDLLCTDITDDSYGPKVDAGVDDPFYVSIPDGYILVAYCVKAGTEPVIVTLDEPIVGPADALIDHPNKDSVSHYQLKLIEDTTTLPGVEVKFTSTQPTCSVLKGSFQFGLAPDQGQAESVVDWTVDTGSGPQAGTPGVVYTANPGTSVTVVATATKGYGLSGDDDGVITFGPVTFTAADDCLDTLALTGGTSDGLIGLAAAMVLLGGLGLAVARRQSLLQRD